MTDPIQEMVKMLENYTEGVREGFNTFVQMAPILIKQDISNRAKKKLDTSKDDYMSAVSVKSKDYLIVVELDRESWLANAVESGVGQFDMRSGLLSSPKAKRSAKGYRYMSIPIGKKKDGKPADNDKSRAFQDKINQVLEKPIFGQIKNAFGRDGRTIYQKQAVVSGDPALSGLYRTRTFESAAEMHSGKKPKWQFVLFRTVSDNPLSKASWQHPGIKPAHIFRDTEQWIDSTLIPMANDFIKDELKARGIDI
jgi:hypothetical protein